MKEPETLHFSKTELRSRHGPEENISPASDDLRKTTLPSFLSGSKAIGLVSFNSSLVTLHTPSIPCAYISLQSRASLHPDSARPAPFAQNKTPAPGTGIPFLKLGSVLGATAKSP